MPIYVFERPNGEHVDHVCQPVDEGGPRIGSTMVINGEQCTRIPSFHFYSKAQAQKNKYPYLSNSLSHATHGCTLVRDPRSGRSKPLIESRKHEREVAARNDLVKD